MKITDANIEPHMHPKLDFYLIRLITQAMEKNEVDVVSLTGYNSNIFPEVKSQVEDTFTGANIDDKGIILPDGKVLLNAAEYDTKEEFHILSVGYSFDTTGDKVEIRRLIDTSLENKAFIFITHPFADEKTRTIGHISNEGEKLLEDLCREYEGDLALEWNGYCVKELRLALKVLVNGSFKIPLLKKSVEKILRTEFDKKVEYHDVNEKVLEFAEKLKSKGVYTPIVAGTDLHIGNSIDDLNAIGTSRIIVDLEGETASDLICSLKEQVRRGNHRNIMETVSIGHFIQAYGLPMLLPNIYEKTEA